MDAASFKRKGFEWNPLMVMVMVMALLVSFSLLLVSAPMEGKQEVGILKLQHLYQGMLESEGVAVKKELMEHLTARDLARQHRILSDVIGFPVGGTADPHVAGLYFTQIKLGTPAKSYFVQVDTGSDVLWLNCKPCQSCPTSSSLGISLLLYDPITSSTCTPIKCKDPTCDVAAKITQAGCNSVGNCGYIFQYGDGSSTEGYLVEDAFLYEAVVPGSALQPVEARLTFGCGYNQSGDLLTPIRALDGILGLGQNDLSVISQLASQGRAPKVFAHCLQGLKHGGGALVLGNVKEYGFVYTPIIPTRLHYSVELKSILVSGIALNVDPAAFETSNVKGTIFDSGTTLTYLTETAYEPLVNAVITDNAVNCKKMGKLLEEEYPNICWTPCASHFLDLLIEDIGKIVWVRVVMEQATFISSFFITKPKALAIYREYCSLELLRPAQTRYAYMFLVLERLLKVHADLRRVVVSTHWAEWPEHNDPQSQDIQHICLEVDFWRDVESIVTTLRPIYSVLRLTDREGSTMGLIYEFMERLMQALSTCTSLSTSSVDSHFPNITLRFNGGDMELKASNYLIQQISDESPPVWCFSWKKSTPGSPNNGAKLTILGDLVLKDKIIVYDLEKKQIGWVNFDCSSTLTVAATGEDHYAKPGDENSASIPTTTKCQIQIIAISILAIFFTSL